MTNEEEIRILKLAIEDSKEHISFCFDLRGIKALEMAIKALEQQLRDCKTCKHSDNGNCAGTEECHECMWESKYEQQPCEDCISREAVNKLKKYRFNYDTNTTIPKADIFVKITDIAELPSVTPKANDKLKYLTDRPCEVCEFHSDNGCSRWRCVFEEVLNDT